VLIAAGISGLLVIAFAANARALPKEGEYLIVPGKSIGPVRLGESRAGAQAVLGREEKLKSAAPDVHYYPSRALFVDYRGGLVVEIRDSYAAPGQPIIVSIYHTKRNFGLGDEFNRFASLFPARSCSSFTYKGGPMGDEEYVDTNCRVRAKDGNYTDFDFVGPASGERDCYGITVYAKSVAAPL
jgi:hypothetical protein